MIYASARFANAEHTQVIGEDANGDTETVPADHTLFRQPDDGPIGFVAKGGVIDDFLEPTRPLPDLEPWRFFAMLDLSGKRSELEAFIDGLPDPDKTVARNKLERSSIFQRDNDLVQRAQIGLGLATGELDALWSQAASID